MLWGHVGASSLAFCLYPQLLVLTAVPLRGGEGERVADFKEPGIAWRKSTACDSGACLQVTVVDGIATGSLSRESVRGGAGVSGSGLVCLPGAGTAQ